MLKIETDLYEALRTYAASEHRSIVQQVHYMLRGHEAVKEHLDDQKKRTLQTAAPAAQPGMVSIRSLRNPLKDIARERERREAGLE